MRRSGLRAGSSRPISLELKVKDLNDSYVIGGTGGAGQLILVNGIQAGTDYSQRLGRQARILSVMWRGTFEAEIPASYNKPLGQKVRFMLIVDRQANAVDPTVTPGISGFISYILKNGYDVNSFNNLDNRERFVVLTDKLYEMGPMGQVITSNTVSPAAITTQLRGVGGYKGSLEIQGYKRMNITTTYKDATANWAAIATNAIFFLIFTDDPDTNMNVTWKADVRCRFVDG